MFSLLLALSPGPNFNLLILLGQYFNRNTKRLHGLLPLPDSMENYVKFPHFKGSMILEGQRNRTLPRLNLGSIQSLRGKAPLANSFLLCSPVLYRHIHTHIPLGHSATHRAWGLKEHLNSLMAQIWKLRLRLRKN